MRQREAWNEGRRHRPGKVPNFDSPFEGGSGALLSTDVQGEGQGGRKGRRAEWRRQKMGPKDLNRGGRRCKPFGVAKGLNGETRAKA